MQGGRTLIIVGVVILVLVLIVGAVLLVSSNLFSGPAPVPTEVPIDEPGPGNGGEAVPEGMVQIVVAAQNIPRGTRITADNNAVKTMMWPQSALPEGVLVDVTASHGRIARQDIPIDMPITEGMLTSRPGEMAAVGSDAALLLPPGRVAYAMPIARWSGVAWAIQPGDHVDVLISLLIVDLDQDFQTELPNDQMTITPVGEEGTGQEEVLILTLGRLEALPDGTLVIAVPGEEYQRPRLVTQMVIQDAIILQVGDWEAEEPEEEAPPEEEEGTGEEAPPEEGDGTEQATMTAEVSIEINKSVTLGVTPQDALVLKYLEELGASIDLVIRSANDAGDIYTTQAVTLDYVFERYAIEVPPKLPYGPSPPIFDLAPSRMPRRELDSTSASMTMTVTGDEEAFQGSPDQ